MSGLAFLLGQIGLTLLLAAIAGWYLGWTWRGFRERDRVEDLRRTLRATEEVKDRDLTEAHHRVASLESQVEHQQRLAERLERDLQEARTAMQASARVPTEAVQPDPVHHPASAALIASDPLPALGELHERLAEAEGRLDAEAARRREAVAALRDKTGALLALQAELQTMRAAASERAAELARLETRVVELEGPGPRIAAGSEASLLKDDRGEQFRLGEQLEQARRQVTALERAVDGLRAEIDTRDRRINELRLRCQDTANALEDARARNEQLLSNSQTTADSSELGELRRLLQRQVERNRKQEMVHRAVVANLQAEIAAVHTRVATPAPLEADEPEAAAGNGAARALLEGADELTQIHGIGPKLAIRLEKLGILTFAQIASWTEDDIDRVARQLGDLTDRIRRDAWVESAREQLRAKYGSVPWR